MSWRKHKTLPPLSSLPWHSFCSHGQQVRSCGHPWPADSPWEVQDELSPAPEGQGVTEGFVLANVLCWVQAQGKGFRKNLSVFQEKTERQN